MAQTSEIYPWDTRMIQYTPINMIHDINCMIILTDAEAIFIHNKNSTKWV